ncbi:protease inhibitor I42 family protein [Chloroflexota bacterium]
MKTKILLILTILIATLLVSSCIVTSRAIGVEISCDEFTESPHSILNEFEVEIGDKITVELCSNPTTGFEWDYEITVDNVVKEEDHDFEEPDRDVPGAPSVEIWTFEATEKGTTEVHMEYSRPWEGGEEAEWTYTITITVE